MLLNVLASSVLGFMIGSALHFTPMQSGFLAMGFSLAISAIKGQ